MLHLSTTHVIMTAEVQGFVNSHEKVAARFGHFAVKSPGKMRTLKSSVLCFCAQIVVFQALR